VRVEPVHNVEVENTASLSALLIAKLVYSRKEDSDMGGEVTLKGTIVEKDPASPLPAQPDDGLYLFTENHRVPSVSR
jgi:hypothetical protein